jgi:hypothetical protein
MAKQYAVARDDRWKPVLRGDVYCSPACGLKCKKSAYDSAIEGANKLASVMGDGWSPDVWENCGWHFRVIKGCASINANRDGLFTAYFNASRQFIAKAYDPMVALASAVMSAREFSANLLLECDEVLPCQ